MPNALELTGKRFGRLVVLRREKVEGARNVMWRCQCDCGNTTLGAASNLGKQKRSCGCLAKEVNAASLEVNRLARPHLHGMSKSPEYKTWASMKGRCLNPKNPKFFRYGARGIAVCERWVSSFENFFADMGVKPTPEHSIDRIDNDGDYEPSNCRWATDKIQARNRSSTTQIELDGLTLCLKEWCERLDIPLWKATELTRNRGAKRNLPPRFETIDEAVRFLCSEQPALA